ncbi:MAG TPA: phage major capsid protein [Candidatus Limnocylindria bacterium]|jgi:HK97 family phage major capsid protein|nr:phage major capsid protein [Candidatus Limnocylindria bacterium]
MEDGEFEKKVLDGIDAQRKKTEQLVTDFNRLDGETKKSFEDLTKLQKLANDSASASAKIQRQLMMIEGQLRRERLMAYGSPTKRISADDEMRERLNLAVRLAVSKEGDMVKLVADRIKALGGTGLLEETRLKALGEDSSPGSTLINTALARELYDTLASYGIWPKFGVRRLGTKITKFPVKTARVVANWLTSEASQISDDSNKAGTSVNCTVEPFAALLNVSLQLLQDAEFDVTADIVDDFGEAAAFRLDYTCLQADGTSNATMGGYTGIISGGTAAGAASTHTTVETLDEPDVRKCLTTVDPVVLSRRAGWLIHPQFLVRLLAIKDGNGRSIFLNALEAPSAGGIGSIFGYPVWLAMAMPTTNTASKPVAVFGDPEGLVVGMRQDFVFEGNDSFKWDYLQRSFRGYGRAGIIIRRSQAFAVLTTAAS